MIFFSQNSPASSTDAAGYQTITIVSQFIRTAADNAGELQTIETGKIKDIHTQAYTYIYKLLHRLQLNEPE